MTTAGEIMHTGATCIQENETLEDAARRMSELDVGALPICGEDDRLHGIITDRDIDIVVKCLAKGKDPKTMTAGMLEQGKPITIDAEADTDQVLRAMEEHKIRRLPVIDNHRLVGMISEADLARRLPEEGVRHHGLERLRRSLGGVLLCEADGRVQHHHTEDRHGQLQGSHVLWLLKPVGQERDRRCDEQYDGEEVGELADQVLPQPSSPCGRQFVGPEPVPPCRRVRRRQSPRRSIQRGEDLARRQRLHRGAARPDRDRRPGAPVSRRQHGSSGTHRRVPQTIAVTAGPRGRP